MTLVAARVYRGGRCLRDLDLTDTVALPQLQDGDFAWVGLHDPTADEMARCARLFGLHPLAVEDAINGRQLPKVEQFGDELFIVARTAALKGDAIVYGETAIFLGRDHIVTVRHGSDIGHGGLRARLEDRPALLAMGPDYVAHEVLDLIVDHYFPVIDAIEARVDQLERQAMLDRLSTDEIREIVTLRRELLHFGRMLVPMEDVAGRLASLELPAIDAEARPYFRDIHDHVRRVSSMVLLMRDVLGSVIEIGALMEQQRQGDITRQLAAWAAILAVPTAIAGVYGMNFATIPGTDGPLAFLVTVAVMLAACVLLFWRFRRIGWL